MFILLSMQDTNFISEYLLHAIGVITVIVLTHILYDIDDWHNDSASGMMKLLRHQPYLLLLLTFSQLPQQ